MAHDTFGSTFTWDGVAVAGLNNINGIEVTADTFDVTTHSSTAAFKEFMAGLLDGGEVSIDGFFDNSDTTGQQAMLVDQTARAAKTGIITFPTATGTTWTFSGVITSVKIGDAPLAAGIPFSAKIKVSGQPTLAVATVTGMSACTIDESAVLAPAFAVGTFAYVATVLNGVSSCKFTCTSTETITLTAGSATQTLTSTVESGAVALAVGLNTVTVVISDTAKISKTYTFTVVRAA
jgi:predicted secreted protein